MKAWKVKVMSPGCPFQGIIYATDAGHNTNSIYFRQHGGRLMGYILPGKQDEMKIIRYGWKFYDQPEQEDILSIGKLLERLNIQ